MRDAPVDLSIGFITAALVSLVVASAQAQSYYIKPGEAVLSYGSDHAASLDYLDCEIVLGQPLAGRMTSADYTLDVGVLSVPFSPMPLTPVFWNAAAGNWKSPANWLPMVIPDNNDNFTYAVYVQNIGSNDVITLNTNPSITELHMSAGAVLRVNENSGTLVRSIPFDPSPVSNASNAGTILVSPSRHNRELDILYMQLLQTPTGLLDVESPDANTQGTLFLIDCSVQGGTIMANGPGALVQFFNFTDPLGTALDGTTLLAEDGGRIEIFTAVDGSAQFSAPGGTIIARPDIGGSTLAGSSITVNNGLLDVDGTNGQDYTATFTGTAFFDGEPIPHRPIDPPPPSPLGSSPPVLHLGAHGKLIVASDITFATSTGVQLEAGSSITLGGNWNNFSDSPTGFDSASAHVELQPPIGSPPGMQLFELAGQDRGTDIAAGLVNNFALDHLTIDPNATVSFVDTVNNSTLQSCDEVLYVRQLSIGSGSNVTVDCGKIYYQSSAGSGNGYALSLQNGGAIVYVGIAGDINGDGQVTVADVPVFVAALLNGMGANPDTFLRSDLNHDGNVDGQDIPMFIQRLIP